MPSPTATATSPSFPDLFTIVVCPSSCRGRWQAGPKPPCGLSPPHRSLRTLAGLLPTSRESRSRGCVARIFGQSAAEPVQPLLFLSDAEQEHADLMAEARVVR